MDIAENDTVSFGCALLASQGFDLDTLQYGLSDIVVWVIGGIEDCT